MRPGELMTKRSCKVLPGSSRGSGIDLVMCGAAKIVELNDRMIKGITASLFRFNFILQVASKRNRRRDMRPDILNT
jgi:hypothetical protein